MLQKPILLRSPSVIHCIIAENLLFKSQQRLDVWVLQQWSEQLEILKVLSELIKNRLKARKKKKFYAFSPNFKIQYKINISQKFLNKKNVLRNFAKVFDCWPRRTPGHWGSNEFQSSNYRKWINFTLKTKKPSSFIVS